MNDRINITIPHQMLVDLKKYAADNLLGDVSGLIRHLIRMEIYIEKSLQPTQEKIKENINKQIKNAAGE